jgi:hypothetical protein
MKLVFYECQQYVEKHNKPLALLKFQMIVLQEEICPKVNLKIRGGGVDFVSNLIVLEWKGIDIILGIHWLSKHKVLIDYAKKSVKLTTPYGKELELVAELVVTAKGVANHVKVNQLDASLEPIGTFIYRFSTRHQINHKLNVSVWWHT